MTIECACIENNHQFFGNPIFEQHKLRYQSIIKRQSWDVPSIRNMEFDQYDTPAAYYLIKRNQAGQAIGVSRLCSTARPYMLHEHFPHLFSQKQPPHSEGVWETTRFCVDYSLSTPERKKVVQELVVAHLEFALMRNVQSIIAVTYPVLWKTIFIKSGWNVEWLGEVFKSDEGSKIIAGELKVSKEVLSHVREITGFNEQVINYGLEENPLENVA